MPGGFGSTRVARKPKAPAPPRASPRARRTTRSPGARAATVGGLGAGRASRVGASSGDPAGTPAERRGQSRQGSLSTRHVWVRVKIPAAEPRRRRFGSGPPAPRRPRGAASHRPPHAAAPGPREGGARRPPLGAPAASLGAPQPRAGPQPVRPRALPSPRAGGGVWLRHMGRPPRIGRGRLTRPRAHGRAGGAGLAEATPPGARAGPRAAPGSRDPGPRHPLYKPRRAPGAAGPTLGGPGGDPAAPSPPGPPPSASPRAGAPRPGTRDAAGPGSGIAGLHRDRGAGADPGGNRCTPDPPWAGPLVSSAH